MPSWIYPEVCFSNLLDISQSNQVDNQDETQSACAALLYKTFDISTSCMATSWALVILVLLLQTRYPKTGRKQSPFYYANGFFEPGPKKGTTGMTSLCSPVPRPLLEKTRKAESTHSHHAFSHYGGLGIVSRLLTGFYSGSRCLLSPRPRTPPSLIGSSSRKPSQVQGQDVLATPLHGSSCKNLAVLFFNHHLY